VAAAGTARRCPWRCCRMPATPARSATMVSAQLCCTVLWVGVDLYDWQTMFSNMFVKCCKKPSSPMCSV
jgi:hypothetical protein